MGKRARGRVRVRREQVHVWEQVAGSMWNADIKSLDDGQVQQLVIRDGSHELTCAAVVEGWRTDAGFCSFFNRLLASAPFAACFWELPPLTRATLDRPFECVIVDSPALAGATAEHAAFASYFEATTGPAVDFPNLGGDAILVAPCPQEFGPGWPHLAAFVRDAAASQQQALWQRVGECVTRRMSDRPLWVSTAGLGVYWLHVRLDSFPKNYSWRPYTQWSDC